MIIRCHWLFVIGFESMAKPNIWLTSSQWQFIMTKMDSKDHVKSSRNTRNKRVNFTSADIIFKYHIWENTHKGLEAFYRWKLHVIVIHTQNAVISSNVPFSEMNSVWQDYSQILFDKSELTLLDYLFNTDQDFLNKKYQQNILCHTEKKQLLVT